MLIASFQKLTLLDYPGRLAALIFTPGCNFRCHFCHNPELVDPVKIKSQELIPEEKILDFLTKRKKLLEGVVITGGEPMLQVDLLDFIKKLKRLNYLVKLDTNGTNPEILNKLIKAKLIDFIAMDIKGSMEKYTEIAGLKIDPNKIKKSIKLIMNSGLDYEFRTTILPVFHQKKDFEAVGRLIRGAKAYYLQQFEPKKTLNPAYRKQDQYSMKKLQEFATILKKYVKRVGIRGI